MRSDEAIGTDTREPKMYRLAVEYIAESRGVPQSRIYQDALDALLADFDWSSQEFRDYCERRGAVR